MVSVRYKILIVVISLFLFTMILLTSLSIGFSRSGITKIAVEFLSYKVNEVKEKANTEMTNLSKTEFADNPEFIEEVKNIVIDYARSIASGAEFFVAVDKEGIVQLSTDSFLPKDKRITFLNTLIEKETGWVDYTIEGTDRVGAYTYFPEWDYYFVISVFAKMFYKDTNMILTNSIIVLIVSVILSSILIYLFINYLLSPLKVIVNTMRKVSETNDLTLKVPVRHMDELGELSISFNNMLLELDGAYNEIKSYAYRAVLSQKKEEQIKTMFQKYVPQDVVDEIVSNPDKALVGKNSKVSVLFSDIRSFTTISETMAPDVLVNSLNRYFSIMVDIIYKRRGIIDKYIGDAIMAIFGAPKVYGDDVQQAVLSGLEMLENLDVFNAEQRRLGLKEFFIGIGINYGLVTLGNIGTTQKMDYTVIGDAVNLASRLEGLTKEYKTGLIISEDACYATKDYFYMREIDRVRVKGKFQPVKIFEPARFLTNKQKDAWSVYNKGMQLFLDRAWDEAEKLFIKSLELLDGKDYLSEKYILDIRAYRENPPDKDWDGVAIMTHK